MRSPVSQQVMHLLGASGVKSPQQISRQPPPIWMVSRFNTAGFPKKSSALTGTHFGGRTPVLFVRSGNQSTIVLRQRLLTSRARFDLDTHHHSRLDDSECPQATTSAFHNSHFDFMISLAQLRHVKVPERRIRLKFCGADLDLQGIGIFKGCQQAASRYLLGHDLFFLDDSIDVRTEDSCEDPDTDTLLKT